MSTIELINSCSLHPRGLSAPMVIIIIIVVSRSRCWTLEKVERFTAALVGLVTAGQQMLQALLDLACPA